MDTNVCVCSVECLHVCEVCACMYVLLFVCVCVRVCGSLAFMRSSLWDRQMLTVCYVMSRVMLTEAILDRMRVQPQPETVEAC